MKEGVMLKSYQNGICLHLNEELSFEELLKQIADKFQSARSFFGSTNVVISMDGRKLNQTEELKILKTIRDHSDLKIVCVLGKDEETDKLFIKALRETFKKMSAEGFGQFYKGTLTDKEVLETQQNIIILGDVTKGCKVISRKNIIILGGLYGEAYAGAAGDNGCYVAALEMSPMELKIGDFSIHEAPGKRKWIIRSKLQPKIAFVKNRRIVYDPLTKELPKLVSESQVSV